MIQNLSKLTSDHVDQHLDNQITFSSVQLQRRPALDQHLITLKPFISSNQHFTSSKPLDSNDLFDKDAFYNKRRPYQIKIQGLKTYNSTDQPRNDFKLLEKIEYKDDRTPKVPYRTSSGSTNLVSIELTRKNNLNPTTSLYNLDGGKLPPITQDQRKLLPYTTRYSRKRPKSRRKPYRKHNTG